MVMLVAMLVVMVVVSEQPVGRSIPCEDEQPSSHRQDLDRCAVERGECRGRQDVFWSSECRSALHQVEHSVDHRQHRVHLVGHEENRKSRRSPTVIDDGCHLALASRVECQEWFVEQEQRGISKKALRDAKSLLLTPGEETDRDVGKLASPHRFEGSIDLSSDRSLRHGKAKTSTRETELDQLATPDRKVTVEASMLGHVSDSISGILRLAAADRDGSFRGFDLAEKHPDQGGLARSIRSKHRDELPGRNFKIEFSKHRSRAIACADVMQGDNRPCAHDATLSAAASSSTWRSCHATNVSPTGSTTSETGTTAMPDFVALDRTSFVTGLVV